MAVEVLQNEKISEEKNGDGKEVGSATCQNTNKGSINIKKRDEGEVV